jgi:hypothetical protein
MKRAQGRARKLARRRRRHELLKLLLTNDILPGAIAPQTVVSDWSADWSASLSAESVSSVERSSDASDTASTTIH